MNTETIIQEDGWIKVEDGLPELFDNRYSDRVLCFTSSGLMTPGFILNGEWIYDGRSVPFTKYGYTLTHWRPLPPPPAKGFGSIPENEMP